LTFQDSAMMDLSVVSVANRNFNPPLLASE
jgi:hypothetical protein